EDDVAAHRRPYQPNSHTWLLDPLLYFFFRAELGHAQKLPDDLRSHDHLLSPPFGDLARLFAGDGRNLAFQIANAGFSREAVDNFLQRLVAELDLLADLQAVFRGLLRDQILVRDVDLLLARVSR